MKMSGRLGSCDKEWMRKILVFVKQERSRCRKAGSMVVRGRRGASQESHLGSKAECRNQRI